MELISIPPFSVISGDSPVLKISDIARFIFRTGLTGPSTDTTPGATELTTAFGSGRYAVVTYTNESAYPITIVPGAGVSLQRGSSPQSSATVPPGAAVSGLVWNQGDNQALVVMAFAATGL